MHALSEDNLVGRKASRCIFAGTCRAGSKAGNFSRRSLARESADRRRASEVSVLSPGSQFMTRSANQGDAGLNVARCGLSPVMTDRAFELASGRGYETIAKIRRQLEAEGFMNASRQLAGPKMREALRKRLADANVERSSL